MGTELVRWLEAAPAEDRAWLETAWPLWQSRDSDPSAFDELLARAAVSARAAGERAQLASKSLAPWLALGRDLTEPEDRDRQERLLSTIADAHALGVASRRDQRARDDAAKDTAIVELAPGVVAAFVTGQPDGVMLDRVFDRLFRRAIATKARFAIVDVSGTDGVDDVLRRTLLGIADAGLPEALRVIACGAAGVPLGDLERTRDLFGALRLAGVIGVVAANSP